MKIPTKKHIKEVVAVIAEDSGWMVDSTLADIATYIRSELKTFTEEAYQEGFQDGQLESQGECECDCRKCQKCEDRIKYENM